MYVFPEEMFQHTDSHLFQLILYGPVQGASLDVHKQNMGSTILEIVYCNSLIQGNFLCGFKNAPHM